MRIFQKNNYITIDFLSRETKVYSIFDKDEKFSVDNAILVEEPQFKGKKKKVFLQKPHVSGDDALKTELESFAESVLYNKNVKVSASDGKKALQTALNIIDKIKQ